MDLRLSLSFLGFGRGVLANCCRSINVLSRCPTNLPERPRRSGSLLVESKLLLPPPVSSDDIGMLDL